MVSPLGTIRKPDTLTKQDRTDTRNRITKFAEELKKAPQIDPPIIHHFAQDVYGREMRAKKGSLIVGKIHKYSNLNIVSQGDVTVISIDGVFRLRAPASFVASAGVQRVLYMHEDTVWTVVHGTNETDLSKIEEQFIAKDYSQVPGITVEELQGLISIELEQARPSVFKRILLKIKALVERFRTSNK